MANFDLIRSLAQKTETKIVLLVVDGLGGLPHPEKGRSELEAAHTPNLDRLARGSQCGLSLPVAHGITPGSGPGHLALFGYDPLTYQIGRGILEALGLDMTVKQGDVAVRGNYSTLNEEGLITDRRAGRIATSLNQTLTAKLGQIPLDGATVTAGAGREHRFALTFQPTQGTVLSDAVADSDPQREGLPPREVAATAPEGEATARIVQDFLEKAHETLKDSHPANGLVLRGFSQTPDLPQMRDVYLLDPVAIASYPMYRGLSKLLGMDVVPTGETIEDEFATLRQTWDDHDFFFVHYKPTDSAGEDGDFDRKVQAIERLDQALPALLDMNPDVLVVAGDHSTPSALAGHSWHPVPLMIRSPWIRRGYTEAFTERECARGALGTIAATDVMPLALANARKLDKFGA